MFSFSEMIFILVLALIFIGPKQLPEVARTIGRFINEMKRASESAWTEMKRSDNIQKNLQTNAFKAPQKAAASGANPDAEKKSI